jgi:hypothetical protein
VRGALLPRNLVPDPAFAGKMAYQGRSCLEIPGKAFE